MSSSRAKLKESYLERLIEELRFGVNDERINELANMDFDILKEYNNGLRWLQYDEAMKNVIRKGIAVPVYDPVHSPTTPTRDAKSRDEVAAFKMRIESKPTATDEEKFLLADIQYREALSSVIPNLVRITNQLREDKDNAADYLESMRSALETINSAYQAQKQAFELIQQRKLAMQEQERKRASSDAQPPIRRYTVETAPPSPWNWKKIIGWAFVGAAIAVASAFTLGAAGIIAGGTWAAFAALGAGSAVGGGFIAGGIGAAAMGVIYGIGKGLGWIAQKFKNYSHNRPSVRVEVTVQDLEQPLIDNHNQGQAIPPRPPSPTSRISIPTPPASPRSVTSTPPSATSVGAKAPASVSHTSLLPPSPPKSPPQSQSSKSAENDDTKRQPPPSPRSK